MRRVFVTALLFAGGVATMPSPLLAAQPASQPPAAAAPSAAPSPAGRWEGKLATPMQALDLTVDIVAKGSGWEGVITIPAQNLTQYPLSSVTASGDSASFAMAAPGNPQFTGKVDASGKTWTGEFTQGGGKLPLTLTRTGDAKIDPPKPSTAIDKALEGTWEGTLDVNGRTLRLVLKLSTAPTGLGRGTLDERGPGERRDPGADRQSGRPHADPSAPGHRRFLGGRAQRRAARRYLEAGSGKPSAHVQARRREVSRFTSAAASRADRRGSIAVPARRWRPATKLSARRGPRRGSWRRPA